ncbi:MAG: hypothetical protein PHT07_03150 [Paludibacter sp.]|nr:hypothetical protein [Paludibacter sp.]
MTDSTKIRYIQPPKQLMSGFLNFAKEIEQKCIENGVKFTENDIAEIFNNSFPGKIRANFFLWVGDLNDIIDGMNIILTDLSDLRKDKNSLKGNPIVRSELLFQAFFGEFFRMREISKIFMKLLTYERVLNKKAKQAFVGFYFEAFDTIYEIRNKLIHQGVSFKKYDVNLDLSIFDDLTIEEQEKFISLIKESNTRENTVEIQCAIYIKMIKYSMHTFIEFQEMLNVVLADLIISYEKEVLTITVEKNNNNKSL